MSVPSLPQIPVSWGELLDKLTILEIKRTRIADPAARANVAREYDLLSAIGDAVVRQDEIAPLLRRLQAINKDLWEIEDAIRAEDANADFGPRFVALARSVYARNDERAAVKRAINLTLGSALVEEKSYAHAANAPAVEACP
jgi:hypothetical protein